MEKLEGRIALVTGASRGIGRAIALALAEAGADVAANFVSRPREAAGVKSQIANLGRKCVTIQADVSRAGEVAQLVSKTEKLLGAIDILINNAGISRPQPIEEITEQDWDEVITVNLKSCFLMTQAVLPGMRARKSGRIINVSSVAAQVGGVVGPHYAASKAGMHGLTRFYASRLAGEGVTVNSIAPALVRSDMLAQVPNITPERIPVGRFGEPEEVAEAAVMLARNGYITGQTINVNGGWVMS
jgi:3-oxoacyl-[acyl-carrier protein] reductase